MKSSLTKLNYVSTFSGEGHLLINNVAIFQRVFISASNVTRADL